MTQTEKFELEKTSHIQIEAEFYCGSESAVHFEYATVEVVRNQQNSLEKCFLYRKFTVFGQVFRIFSDYFVNFRQLPLSHDKNGPQIRILLIQENVPIPVTFFLAQKMSLLHLF